MTAAQRDEDMQGTAERKYELTSETIEVDGQLPDNTRRAMELAFGGKLRAALAKARGES